ncbi:MAG: sugar MFS transporter [Oscillospiraceae bacterium]
MGKREDFSHTLFACYLGLCTQAIVNNFAPLLFLTFRKTFGISLEKIALLITVNFVVQLLIDLVSARYVDKAGYRASIVTAHIFSAAGLLGLGILPGLFKDAYFGLVLATVLYAIGGGIIEVLVSPIVEGCPTEKKSANMSLLHAFYCWGYVFVILASTLFFVLAGVEKWRFLTCLWALVPIFNAFYFTRVPISKPVPDDEKMSAKNLVGSRMFWVFAIVMLCSGASEQSMSQWASAFAEAGIGISKTMGDLMGPCLFAAMMGASRLLYARLSEKLDLRKYMLGSCILCIVGYLTASLSPFPILSLLGCALVGFSVAIFWPGTISLASGECPRGGTAMFALLALMGDLGCSTGPLVVGMVSGAGGDDLKKGLITAAVFPIVLFFGIVFRKNGPVR